MRVIIYGVGTRCENLTDLNESFDMGLLINGIEIIGFSDGNPAMAVS